MPGPILHMGAVVTCAHGGMAVPMAQIPNVTVSGFPIVTVGTPWQVAGCAFVPPVGNGPCVTGVFVVGSMCVTSNGMPVAIMSGVSMCVPTATPMIPAWAQTFAVAS